MPSFAASLAGLASLHSSKQTDSDHLIIVFHGIYALRRGIGGSAKCVLVGYRLGAAASWLVLVDVGKGLDGSGAELPSPLHPTVNVAARPKAAPAFLKRIAFSL